MDDHRALAAPLAELGEQVRTYVAQAVAASWPQSLLVLALTSKLH